MGEYRLLLIFAAFSLVSCTGPDSHDLYKPLETVCIGDKNSEANAVYLHGFTDREYSGQERKNIKELRRLAEVMDLRIAIPLSPITCEQNEERQHCWGVDMTRTQAKRALAVATEAVGECFDSDSDFGVIGFSNGGYIATKFFSYCLAPQYQPRLKWIVTVGSAKLWGQGHSNRGSLRHCRPIALVIGKRDRHNYEYRQRYFRRLRAKGARVSILTFQGGHELKVGPLITAIRSFVH